jgi:hypothetical protein
MGGIDKFRFDVGLFFEEWVELINSGLMLGCSLKNGWN